jgi:hypothetical protein
MLANATRAGEDIIRYDINAIWLCNMQYGSLSKNSNCGISWAKLGDGQVARAQATPIPYCKWERWWLCTPRSMQSRFIITSIQIYGTLSRLLWLSAWISQMGKIMIVYYKIHAALVHYHKYTKLWSCSRRPKKCCSMITGVYRPWPSSLIPTGCRHIIVNYLYW